MWQPCLLMDQNKMSKFYIRCFLPSFISFGQMVSEEKLFQKLTNKKQELPMTAMFVNILEQNKQSLQRIFHPYVSYQVSVHLAKRFQRRRLKCEKLRQRTPSDGKSSHCFWQGELTRGFQEPVIAHLVFNQTSKVDRKWGCYT